MTIAFSRALSFVPASLALAGAALVAMPAAAQPAPSGYAATLQSPLAAPRQEILDSALWKCAGDSCTARDAGSRPVLVCQRVVKKFGPVARFTHPAGELSQQDLSRCNGR